MAGEYLDKWRQDVSPDAPAGENLTYDPGYRALFQLAKGKPETQWAPAEEPVWTDVGAACDPLMDRTRDVPLILLKTVTLLKAKGLEGLADGMDLLRDLLDRMWDTVYPRPDPDDGDLTRRVNAVNVLSAPEDATGDIYRFRSRIREVPLTDSRKHGRFSLLDMDVAAGKVPAPAGRAAVDPGAITAAFGDTAEATLKALRDTAARAAATAAAIQKAFADHAGASQTPTLDDVRRVLRSVVSAIEPHLKAPPGPPPPLPPDPPEEDKEKRVQPEPPAVAGEIRTTADVTAAIDRICRFYEAHEPSSPVPMLLLRARRLVGKSFAEVVADLSPTSIQGLSVLSGTDLTAELAAKAAAAAK